MTDLVLSGKKECERKLVSAFSSGCLLAGEEFWLLLGRVWVGEGGASFECSLLLFIAECSERCCGLVRRLLFMYWCLGDTIGVVQVPQK